METTINITTTGNCEHEKNAVQTKLVDIRASWGLGAPNVDQSTGFQNLFELLGFSKRNKCSIDHCKLIIECVKFNNIKTVLSTNDDLNQKIADIIENLKTTKHPHLEQRNIRIIGDHSGMTYGLNGARRFTGRWDTFNSFFTNAQPEDPTIEQIILIALLSDPNRRLLLPTEEEYACVNDENSCLVEGPSRVNVDEYVDESDVKPKPTLLTTAFRRVGNVGQLKNVIGDNLTQDEVDTKNKEALKVWEEENEEGKRERNETLKQSADDAVQRDKNIMRTAAGLPTMEEAENLRNLKNLLDTLNDIIKTKERIGNEVRTKSVGGRKKTRRKAKRHKKSSKKRRKATRRRKVTRRRRRKTKKH